MAQKSSSSPLIKYFLQLFNYPKQQVTEQEFMLAERSAGFYPRGGGGIATGGFSNGVLRGIIEYE